MTRSAIASVIAGLTLFAASAAVAGPKATAGKAASTCEKGVGQYVCCKTYVANHCGHTPCCEVGNAAFYSRTACHTCEARGIEAVKHASAISDDKASAKSAGSACAKSGSSGCSDVAGNAAFFSSSSCGLTKTASK
jgi:hypothetical protein